MPKKNRATYSLLILLLSTGLGAAIWYAESLNNQRYIESTYVDTKDELSRLRSQIQANLNSNIQVIKGLVSVISREPGLSQKDFAMAARPLFDGRSQLRNIAAAPDMVISMVYPVKGNEDALGLDFRQHRQQAATARLARTTGEIVLAGPLDLVQGGRGIIARFPVYELDRQMRKQFWGLLSAVIDEQRFYRESGLLNDQMNIRIALRGKDSQGENGEIFFGDADVFDQDPIILDIPLPYGKWQIAAIPRNGWPGEADNLWRVRLIMILIAALILIPFIALGFTLRALSQAREKLENINSELVKISETDQLTHVANRRGFEERFDLEVNRARRCKDHLTLLMIDVDNFKLYNDNYGHDAGDVALTRLARAIAAALPRGIDYVARYGGEEFVVILPTTGLDGGMKVASRIHNAVKSLQITHEYSDVSDYVTLSIGVASMSADDIDKKKLLRCADEALYNAKQQGRNRTEIMEDYR